MAARASLNSSYPRTFITKNDYGEEDNLLSTLNNNRREPDINDLPIGSSDDDLEDSDLAGQNGQSIDLDMSDLEDRGKRRKKVNGTEKTTLNDRLAGTNDDENEDDAPAGRRRSGRKSLPSKSNRSEPSSSLEKRPSSALASLEGSADDEQDPFNTWSSQHARSSQNSKRRRLYGNQTRTYGQYSAPSSSAPEERPPSSNTQNSKSKKSIPRKKDEKRQKCKPPNKMEAKSSFQIPREVDIPDAPGANGRTESSKQAFKNPPTLNDPELEKTFKLSDDDASPLSSPLSFLSSTFDYDLLQDGSASSDQAEKKKLSLKPALCPMCHEEVDPAALVIFEAQPKQRFREQIAFCESHQMSKAEKEWQSKGYPVIDWDTFDERIRRHFSDLERKLLVPGSSSYYRNLLDSDMKSGKAKNFRLTLSGGGLENISCGYYGTRGSGKMLQAITTHFSHKLRRLAAVDHIVKTAGVAGYAQAVLVPELAVRLVKEDMKVDDQSARQILRDSIGIGEKLNAQQNDVVPVAKELDGTDENQENTTV